MKTNDEPNPVFRIEGEHFLESPPGLYELLESVRKRPAMYLGNKSLTKFDLWLSGYQRGKADAGMAPSVGEEEFYDRDGGFDAFVQDKYDWHDVGGWSAKILYYNRSEESAFDEFFKLLAKFRELKRKERESA